jgi:uncharacterized GH25 family protein
MNTGQRLIPMNAPTTNVTKTIERTGRKPMTVLSTGVRTAAAASLVMALGAALSAHDFWIEASTFEPRLGDAIKLHLRVGERFAGEPMARNSSRIEKFVVSGPSGERPVPGRDGMDPAGLLRLDEPGLWHVAYRSRPSPVQLSAESFEQYLREEGLEAVSKDRAARGESAMPGRERFSRSVKALLRVAGDGDMKGFDRALGLTLELVLGADPAAAPNGRVPVTLRHEGQPLAAALVAGYRKQAGAVGAGVEAFRGRTDRDGRVVVPVEPGVWLLKSVHMQRAAADAGAEWESVWTALTFQVPSSSGDPRRTTESRGGIPLPARRP